VHALNSEWLEIRIAAWSITTDYWLALLML